MKANNLHKVVIDGVDDFEMTRQNSLEHVSRPPLQSLGQDGVVRIGAAFRSNFPGLENDKQKIISFQVFLGHELFNE